MREPPDREERTVTRTIPPARLDLGLRRRLNAGRELDSGREDSTVRRHSLAVSVTRLPVVPESGLFRLLSVLLPPAPPSVAERSERKRQQEQELEPEPELEPEQDPSPEGVGEL